MSSLTTSANANGKTTQAFLSALITNSSLLGVQVAAFVLLKNRLTRIYTPRTFLPPPDKRAEELPSGPWRWLFAVLSAPTKDVIRKNGLDAYMLLRFLWLMLVVFASFTVVTWIIILPVDSAGIHNPTTDGLNKLSWGNIPDDKFERYAAHIVVVYLLTFLVLFLIRRECIHYTTMRQAFLTSPSYSHLPQSRTVLITSIPRSMCTERDIRLWASFVPGGVQNVWVYRDSKGLNYKFKELTDACNSLEISTSSLLRTAVKMQRRRNAQSKSKPKSESDFTSPRRAEKGRERHRQQVKPLIPPTDPTCVVPATPTSLSTPTELESGASAVSMTPAELTREQALLDSLVPLHKRPKHRIRLLEFWSRKVDSIEYYKNRIAELNTEIAQLRADKSEARPLGSAFVQCNLQMGAHVLAQCISYHEPMKMAYKWIQVAPKDVIWDNIDDGIYETRFRYVTSWLISIGLIIAWFFPVSFVGLLSNVSELCEKVHWLGWICRAPTPVPGIIQGVLPPLILAILFAILPIFLRFLAWYENLPLHSLLSISVYKRYFLFLVIHGFLVVTLSSGLTATAAEIINSPTKTVSELASHLPDASVFFLTWTVTQGLTGAGGALLQIFTLLMYYLKKWFLGRTPRQAFTVTFMMPSADFGVVLPQLSLLATISFAYSVLSPVINGLAMMAFGLFYIVWKFLLTWVFDQPDERETGGLYFPIAIRFLFVGLYIEQFCLMALFFLKSSSSEHSFLVQGILMLVLLLITIAAQIFLVRVFSPLEHYLPMSLATQQVQKRVQKHWHEGTDEKDKILEFDLFNREHLGALVRRRAKSIKHSVQRELSTLKQPLSTLLDPLEEASRALRHSMDQAHTGGGGEKSTIEDGVELGTARRTRSRRSHPSTNISPKHPIFDPPAPAPSKKHDHDPYDDNDNDNDSDGCDSDFDENGFEHPSRYKDQPWIWLPKDPLGLSKLFVEQFKKAGVLASDEGAVMDEEGVVEVTRAPPDEAWEGGHDA